MNNHQLEARAAKAKVVERDKHIAVLQEHIAVLQEHIANLQRTIRKTNELVDSLRGAKQQLELFVAFANKYYPGSIEQFKAIKALEGRVE